MSYSLWHIKSSFCRQLGFVQLHRSTLYLSYPVPSMDSISIVNRKRRRRHHPRMEWKGGGLTRPDKTFNHILPCHAHPPLLANRRMMMLANCSGTVPFHFIAQTNRVRLCGHNSKMIVVRLLRIHFAKYCGTPRTSLAS